MLRIYFCATVLTLALSAAAEPVEVRNWTLQDCIQQALEHNLEIRIQRYSPVVSLYNLKGQYGAYDPTFKVNTRHTHSEGDSIFKDPEADENTVGSSLGGMLPWGMTYGLGMTLSDSDSIDYNPFRNSFSSSSGDVALSLTQPLFKDLWLNETRLTIKIRKNELKQSELGLRGKIMDVVTRVELAYYALRASYENIRVQQSALELAQRLLAENKKRVEVGALAPLDEKQSESEVAARQADLISAQSELARRENLLIGLLTDDFAGWMRVDLEPSEALSAERQLFDVQDSWGKGLTQRPDFLAAQITLTNLGVSVKINQNRLYPQVDLTAGGGYRGSTAEFSGVLGDIDDRDQPFYYVGGVLSYPLGNRANRYAHKSSKATYERGELELKQAEQGIMIEIDNAIKTAQASFERVGATRKAREYAEAALAAEQKKLESGKSTSFVVLQLQRDLTDARSSEIGALTTYNIALASLASAEGATLERNRIDLEVK